MPRHSFSDFGPKCHPPPPGDSWVRGWVRGTKAPENFKAFCMVKFWAWVGQYADPPVVGGPQKCLGRAPPQVGKKIVSDFFIIDRLVLREWKVTPRVSKQLYSPRLGFLLGVSTRVGGQSL